MKLKQITLFALFFLLCGGFMQAQIYVPGGTVNAVTNASTNVGIGIANPSSTLHIVKSSNPSIQLRNGTANWAQLGVASCNGCFAPSAQSGDVVLRAQGGGDLLLGVPYGGVDGRAIKMIVKNTVAMSIFDNERVGIGTTNIPASYKLAVADGIITEKVKVAIEGTSNWADYVFEEDYALMKLEEVETFIAENGHLPSVPSAEEVVAEGVNLGEMDATLLRKIEELTLYVIQLQKDNLVLEQKIKALESK